MAGVRNPDGFWINTECFRDAGRCKQKNGWYTEEPYGSPSWYDFWAQERDRCLNGYSVGGARITGDHYFYLNYCPIKVTKSTGRGRTGYKEVSLPDFWEGDYNYFWFREIARRGIVGALRLSERELKKINALDDEKYMKKKLELLDSLQLIYKPLKEDLDGGHDLIIGKSRRKGFSYKNASVSANNFFHRPDTYTMVMAYESKYLYPGDRTFMFKVYGYINYINDNTGWTQPSDFIRKQDHIRASYMERNEAGVAIEKGLMSEIQAVSFKDNPDAGRGADAYDIFGEEVGAWGVPGGLKDTVAAMNSSTEGGMYKTGMMTLFGTSGSLDKGTVDFADMFSEPGKYNFMRFYDIWGDFEDKVEGFFFPKQLNMEGFYDANGNSDMEGAKNYELEFRKKKKENGATSTDIQKRMYEEPLNSSEAFGIISHNSFPVVELKARLELVKAKGLQKTKGIPVRLFREEGKVKAQPVLDGSAEPITSMERKVSNLEGCVIIYEFPQDNPPRGLYKIGYDPIRQDTGTSLAALIVYKGVAAGEFKHDIIVAEYVGRYMDADENDRLAEMLADYFNTTIMYENECTGTKNYFRKIHRLNLLASQPDRVISKNISRSKVDRVYGCHMVEQLKDAGERYIRSWLVSVIDYIDKDGEKIPVTTIDTICSERLLEELIKYNRKGNFDLVSALIMCMFQVQENYFEDIDRNNERKDRQDDVIEMYNEMTML